MTDTWHGAFKLDEDWHYSDEAQKRICEYVDAEYLPHVTRAAQHYISYYHHEQDKPAGAEVSKQLDTLGKRCHELLQALELHEPTIDELFKRNPAVIDMIVRVQNEVSGLRSLAWGANNEFNPRGRRKLESRRDFITWLANIWEHAHGEWPRRSVTGKHETSQFAYFVRECTGELPGFTQGLDDLIREVTTGRKK